MKINFPQPFSRPANDASSIELEILRSLIIVRANGSGKTRLGCFLEKNNAPTKRISAQRYLSIGNFSKQSLDQVQLQLKQNFHGKQPFEPQTDYNLLLSAVFAEEHVRDAAAVAIIQEKGSHSCEQLSKSIKEKIQEIWKFIFPYRELQLENDKIEAIAQNSVKFPGNTMSDGEKVGLYLIAQVLLAETGCILIIDEPELHFHKNLMVNLWNKLEEFRNDCTFVYLTHDLDFAVNKPSGRIIWLKNYQNDIWLWDELAPNGIIPENLYLEMLGSRKPILFVEGEKGSLDIKFYQSYYENFTVIPVASCKQVIESVKGFRNNSSIHYNKVFGLIDRDFRTEEKVNKLEENGIFNLPIYKIENIFLLPQIIELVCKHLDKINYKINKENVLKKIRKQYKDKAEQINLSNIKFQIQDICNEAICNLKKNDQLNEFIGLVNDKLTTIVELDSNSNKPVEDLVDVNEILKIYPLKGLVKEVQGEIDLKNNGYENIVLNFLYSDKKEMLAGILKAYFPQINDKDNSGNQMK